MFRWLTRIKTRAESWRESNSEARGCLLFGVVVLGSMCCFPLFPGVYGDCGGPQRQECIAEKGDLIREAFVWCGCWTAFGVWLASGRKP